MDQVAVLAVLLVGGFALAAASDGPGSDVPATIIALERAALDRWSAGDPSGFLELSAADVTYFDPFQERRLDGHETLTALYERLRGAVRIDRYELLAPEVRLLGDAGAVLTFNLVSTTDGAEMRWNCTEVYERSEQGWRIVQTHWSFTGPPDRFPRID